MLQKSFHFIKKIFRPLKISTCSLSKSKILHTLHITIKTLIYNEAFKEACVLSYYGLLTVIPILVFFLRISQHLFANLNLHEWIALKLPDYQEHIISLGESAKNYSENGIGVVLVGSFFAFFWAGMLILSSLENTLNKIFGMGIYRMSTQRLITYFIITLITPMIFIISCGSWIYITQIMPVKYPNLFDLNHIKLLYRLSNFIPYILLYTLLFLCYAFLPRSSVKKSAAFISAIVMGSLAALGQKGFVLLQVSLFNYSFTYGALVALPSFLLLLYFYSIIYLFGGAFTFFLQNYGNFAYIPMRNHIKYTYIKLVTSIYILGITTKKFDTATKAPTARLIAKKSKLPIGIVSESLDMLIDKGFITETTKLFHHTRYKPSYNLSKETLFSITQKLVYPKEIETISKDTDINFISNSLKDMIKELKSHHSNITIEELMKRF